jgi:hypothetical protein
MSSADIDFRQAMPADFDYCVKLYVAAMAATIRALEPSRSPTRTSASSTCGASLTLRRCVAERSRTFGLPEQDSYFAAHRCRM